MELKILKPRLSLNKAFLKVKPNRPEIEKFKRNLISLIATIDEFESEEFHKNEVSKFLQNTYYSGNHYINTKDRKDLVIHNGADASSTVGVIIEAKKPTNKGEMLRPDAINTKAFQELVLYYLRERITHKNLEIKHLIATNIYEWYIFDAQLFERIFAQNKPLVRKFIDFEEGRSGGNKTDFFYSQIAAPAIEALTHEITFTHFDIREYEKPLRNNNPKDDNLLIALFKLLSPEHLLKLPFANDSNSLDKIFYTELLHIIGLTETKEGGKKLIQRKDKALRNAGSLIESAIVQLDNLDKIARLEKPSQFGDTTDERLFNVALELSITWINRILFLKLLEAQLIKYHKGDKTYAFLNTDKVKNFDDLNTLFFQVLAKKPDERNDEVKQLFAHVPYLNSSLFEPTDIEHACLFISQLKDGNLPVLSNSVIKDKTGKKKTGELLAIDYVFEFLNAYDFSSEGSEEIQEDNKRLINASVLGLIFEKINGYKDGSFFTPGFITMYMCRETIRRAVLQKFNETKAWNCKEFGELYDNIESGTEARIEANAIINSLKICDPAVGSGHFLVSALNEIIAIKSELRILSDRDGKRLKEYSVVVENDELIVTDEDGKLFEYNPANRESQRVQETLFHEKQTIIENCLFGVDLNPNSVKICRLRLWIELLKNAYYRIPAVEAHGRAPLPEKPELETLPNIDINIKCGNSLISRYALDADIKKALKRSKWTIDSYRLAVMTYRNAQSKDEKRAMERLIREIKGDFESEIATNDKRLINLNTLKGELYKLANQTQLFELSKSEKSKFNKAVQERTTKIDKLEAELDAIRNNKIYENAFEWRFEFPEVLNDEGDFIGFDVVIGNPPYIYNRDLPTAQRDFLKNKYQAADDLYVYFTHEGLSMSNSNGLMSFITPNTYFTLSTRTNFRRKLLSYSEIKFTYSGYCFEDAFVETMICYLSKDSKGSNKVTFISTPKDYVNFESYSIERELLVKNMFSRFYIPTDVNISLNNKINAPLKVISEKHFNSLLGKGKSEDIISYNNNILPGDFTFLGLISEGEQGLVTGNNSKYVGCIVDTLEQKYSIDSKFLNILNDLSSTNYDLTDINQLYVEAEKIKITKKNPSVFGKFLQYKTVYRSDVKLFSDLSLKEKNDGGSTNLWVFYNRGNTEGYKWFVPYTECINWSSDSVVELKEGVKTNSRWQGCKFYNVTGFGWVDYFSDRLKSFFVEEGVYSKNIVKLHSVNPLITDKYIVAILNSKLISYYVKNFITSTHTLQINDGRLVPLIVPTNEELIQYEKIVDEIIVAKKMSIEADTTTLETEIDQLVYELYGLTEDEIRIVEGVK